MRVKWQSVWTSLKIWGLVLYSYFFQTIVKDFHVFSGLSKADIYSAVKILQFSTCTAEVVISHRVKEYS